MMRKVVFILVFVVACAGQAAVRLAENGQPRAEIVVAEAATEVEIYAAEELRHWVKAISGAELPIVREAGAQPVKLILTVNPQEFAADLEKIGDTDGYAVRSRGNTVYVIASKPKGILNGVYRMLFKNTDIIWARPNEEFGTVFTPDSGLALTQTDYIDVPEYVLRGWQMISRKKPHMLSELWQIRNGSNWSAELLYLNSKYTRFGMSKEFGGGHNLIHIYLPEKKYFDTHPDFYSMRGGKRIKPSEESHLTQLCFTNPAMTEAFIAELDVRIKANPDYDTYRIMTEDNYNLCECPECMKPIEFPGGETVKPEDKDFRSTQFFMWLNEIGRHMRKEYPAKRILTFAYLFTATPPRCAVEPNISISFCPVTKDSRYPVTARQNSYYNESALGWWRRGADLTWREYFGLVGAFPRPADQIAFADWRYAHKHGVNCTYSEMYADSSEKIRNNGFKSWNLNSMYFWVMMQGTWNPHQDVEKLRWEFLNRVYGPAAADIEDFYRLIADSWFEKKHKSTYLDWAVFSWQDSVLADGIEDKCRAALKRAASKAVHPNGKEMLSLMRDTFEEMIARAKRFHVTARQVSSAPRFDPDFQTGDWEKAEAVTEFLHSSDFSPAEPTAFRILYDDRNLYVGVKCFDRAPKTMSAKTAGQPRDSRLSGDRLLFYLIGHNKVEYTIVTDINGNIYDASGDDKDWNGDYQLERKITGDGWSVMLTIPWKTLQLDAHGKSNARIMIYRYWQHREKSTEVSSWLGGTRRSFGGEIKFK